MAADARDLGLRERVLEATFACVGRFGMGKTTVEDVAKASGVSRATIYRYFPGGREELIREVVAWEVGRFMGRLAEAVAGAPDLASLVEEALRFGHRALREHEVLQKVLATEPERLLPLLTVDHRPQRVAGAFLRPSVERAAERGLVRPGVDVDEAVDYVTRMVLSFAASPGPVDLEDPDAVREIVRRRILGGVLAAPGGGTDGPSSRAPPRAAADDP